MTANNNDYTPTIYDVACEAGVIERLGYTANPMTDPNRVRRNGFIYYIQTNCPECHIHTGNTKRQTNQSSETGL